MPTPAGSDHCQGDVAAQGRPLPHGNGTGGRRPTLRGRRARLSLSGVPPGEAVAVVQAAPSWPREGGRRRRRSGAVTGRLVPAPPRRTAPPRGTAAGGCALGARAGPVRRTRNPAVVRRSAILR